MKKFILIVLCTVFYAPSSAQFRDLRDLKKDTVTILTRKGERYFGKARVKKSNEHIDFHPEDGSENIIFDYTTLDTLYLHSEGTMLPHVYKIIEENDNRTKIMLLEIERNGNLKLFSFVRVGGVGGFGGGFGGMPASFYGGSMGEYALFYLAKGDDMFVHKIINPSIRSKNFINFIEEYIHDCPSLLKKIKQKAFNDDEGLQAVIDYYNNQCPKAP